MTLKTKKIDENKTHEKIAIVNDITEYVILKRKHQWHSLKISKIMKKNINLFLKESTRKIFSELQAIAIRQNEILSHLSEFKTHDKDVFGKMFKDKYLKEQNDNITKTKELLNKIKRGGLSDFYKLEDGLITIKPLYCQYLIDNKWFEAICFYLLASLKITSKLYLDVDLRLKSGETVQIDNVFITRKYCALIECKSGDSSRASECLAKLRLYKTDYGADYGILFKAKDNGENKLRQEMTGIFIINGFFKIGAKKLKKKLMSLLR